MYFLFNLNYFFLSFLFSFLLFSLSGVQEALSFASPPIPPEISPVRLGSLETFDDKQEKKEKEEEENGGEKRGEEKSGEEKSGEEKSGEEKSGEEEVSSPLNASPSNLILEDLKEFEEDEVISPVGRLKNWIRVTKLNVVSGKRVINALGHSPDLLRKCTADLTKMSVEVFSLFLSLFLSLSFSFFSLFSPSFSLV